MVWTEDELCQQVAFRWVSHVGFDRTTLISPKSREIVDEYAFLGRAAVLRAQLLNHKNEWVVDDTTYPNRPVSNCNNPPGFAGVLSFQPQVTALAKEEAAAETAHQAKASKASTGLATKPIQPSFAHSVGNGSATKNHLPKAEQDLLNFSHEEASLLEPEPSQTRKVQPHLLDDPPLSQTVTSVASEVSQTKPRESLGASSSSNSNKMQGSESNPTPSYFRFPSLSTTDQRKWSLPVHDKNFLSELEASIYDKAELLRTMPGHISLEIVFGRIYFKAINPAKVSSGNLPYFQADAVKEFFDKAEATSSPAGFASVLSTWEADAKLFLQSLPKTTRKSGWKHIDAGLYCELNCTIQDGSKIVIKVDLLGSSPHKCRYQEQEVFCVYVHCARMAWDLKVRAVGLGNVDRHLDAAEFAADAVKSVHLK